MPSLYKERRLVKIGIASDFLFQMITQGNEMIGGIKTEKGIPPDAVFISSHFDDKKMQAYLVFYHPNYAPLGPGDEIPFIDVVCHRFNEPKADEIYLAKMREYEAERV